MKFSFGILLTMIFLASCASTKTPGLKDKSQILSLLKAQESAWNNADIDAFMEAYWNNEDMSFIGKSGVNKGWNTTKANYKKNYPTSEHMGQLHFDIIETKPLGSKNFMVIGKFTLIRKDDQPSGYFTLIWEKIEGEWKIVSDHTSG